MAHKWPAGCAHPRRHRSRLVWIIEIDTLKPVGCVTGVGNESYLLDVLPAAPH
jgi:hypothetical protein